MDKWTEVQAARMQLGGNNNCLKFFRDHPDYKEGMPIPEKYQSEFAILYKEKLAALCAGEPWEMPPIGSRKPAALEQPIQNTRSHIGLPTKAQNEEYFSRIGAQNSNRPDNIPPSQGGKYSGFGSSNFDSTISNSQSFEDDPMAAVAKGWGFLSSIAVASAKLAVKGAETLGKTVNEKVITPATTAVRDPEFNTNLNSYVSTITSTVAKAGQTGMSLATDYAQKGMEFAKETINDLQQMDNFQDGRGDWSEQSERFLSNEDGYAMPTNSKYTDAQPEPSKLESSNENYKQMDDFSEWGIPASKKDQSPTSPGAEAKEWEEW